MISNLYEKTLYTKNVSWIIHEMFEYDIQKANISILLENGYIDRKAYNMFSMMDRNTRQVSIGRMQHNNPQVATIINNGFKQARKLLIESNQIDDEEIISIRKDALCVMRRLKNLDFSNIHFTEREAYTMMLRCKGLEIYFGYDQRTNLYNIDIKGISDKYLPFHSTFIDNLCNWLTSIQNSHPDNAIIDIMNYMHMYEERKLPLDCYREFNSSSMVRLGIGTYSIFDIPSELDPGVINIDYNREVLRELFGIFAQIQHSV